MINTIKIVLTLFFYGCNWIVNDIKCFQSTSLCRWWVLFAVTVNGLLSWLIVILVSDQRKRIVPIFEFVWPDWKCSIACDCFCVLLGDKMALLRIDSVQLEVLNLRQPLNLSHKFTENWRGEGQIQISSLFFVCLGLIY